MILLKGKSGNMGLYFLPMQLQKQLYHLQYSCKARGKQKESLLPLDHSEHSLNTHACVLLIVLTTTALVVQGARNVDDFDSLHSKESVEPACWCKLVKLQPETPSSLEALPLLLTALQPASIPATVPGEAP